MKNQHNMQPPQPPPLLPHAGCAFLWTRNRDYYRSFEVYHDSVCVRVISMNGNTLGWICTRLMAGGFECKCHKHANEQGFCVSMEKVFGSGMKNFGKI